MARVLVVTPKESKPRGANPIRELGLGSKILNWGMDMDKLYHFIRYEIAKRIKANVHPDVTGVDSDESRILIEAAGALDDREVFDSALDELRREKSTVLGEMGITLENNRRLSEKNRALEQEIANLRAQLEEVKVGNPGVIDTAHAYMCVNVLEAHRIGTVFSYNALASQVDSSQDAMPIKNCYGLRLLNMRVGEPVADTPKPIDIAQLRQDYAPLGKADSEANRQALRDRLRATFAGSTLALRRVSELIDSALGSTLALPSIHWDLLAAQRGAGISNLRLHDGKLVDYGGEQLEADSETTKWYREILASVKELSYGAYFGDLHLFQTSFLVSNGIFEFPLTPGTGNQDLAILGSISVSDAKGIMDWSKKEDALLKVDSDWLVPRIRPYLWKGGILVADRVDKVDLVGESNKKNPRGFLEKRITLRRKPFILGVVYNFL